MKKRILSFVMAVVLAVSLLPAMSVPAEAAGVSFTLNFKNGQITNLDDFNAQKDNITSVVLKNNSEYSYDYGDYYVSLRVYAPSTSGMKQVFYGNPVHRNQSSAPYDVPAEMKITSISLYHSSGSEYYFVELRLAYTEVGFEYFNEELDFKNVANPTKTYTKLTSVGAYSPWYFTQGRSTMVSLTDSAKSDGYEIKKVEIIGWGSSHVAVSANYKAWRTDKGSISGTGGTSAAYSNITISGINSDSVTVGIDTGNSDWQIEYPEFKVYYGLHAHTYGGWSTDGTRHWKQCTATYCPNRTDSIKDKANHTVGTPATCTTQAKCATCKVSYGTASGHNFKYTANNNVITATCQNTGVSCPYYTTGITLALTAPAANSLTYNGSTKPATIGNWSASPSPAGLAAKPTTVNYEGRNGTSYTNTTAPKNVGDYTAKITVGSATASVNFSITPAEMAAGNQGSYFTTTASNAVYNGQPRSATVTPKTGITGYGDITVKYQKQNADGTTWGEATTTAPTNVGTYKVVFSLSGGDNIVATTADIDTGVTYTISRATTSITAPTAVTGLIYDGTEQVLINAGATNFGEIEYKLGDGQWTTDVTAIKAANAGNYTVQYRLVATENYTGAESTTVAGTAIAKRVVTLTWKPAAEMDLVYSGVAKVPTVTAGNVVSGESLTVDNELTTSNDNINVGSFTFTATDLTAGDNTDAANYKLPTNVTSPSYAITKYGVTLHINANSANYDGNAHTLDFTPVFPDGAQELTAADFKVTYYEINQNKKTIDTSYPMDDVTAFGKYFYVVTQTGKTENYQFTPSRYMAAAPAALPTDAQIAQYDNIGIFKVDISIPKAQKPISFQHTMVNMYYSPVADNNEFTNPLTNENSGAVTTYTSNNTSVATVNENNGKVTIVGVGNATIIAKSVLADTSDVYASFTLNVTKENVTVTVGNKEAVYGSALDYALTDLTFSKAINTTGMTPVFSGYTAGQSVREYQIKVSGLTSDYYDFTVVPGTLEVTPKTLTVGATGTNVIVSAANKVYDKTRSATLSAVFNAEDSGLVGSDASYLVLNVSGVFEHPEAGENKNVSYNLSLSGAKAGNYTLSHTSGTVKANITKMPVDFTVTGNEVFYDGYGKTVSVTAVDGSEAPFTKFTVKYNGVTAHPIYAGTYPVTVELADTNNYEVRSGLTSVNLVIKPMPISFEFGSGSFPHDGENKAISVTAVDNEGRTFKKYTLSYAGSGSTNYGPSATPPHAVGTYTVTANFTDTTNYVLDDESSNTTTMTITQMPVTFFFGQGQFLYDGGVKTISISAVDDENRVFTDYTVYYEGIDGTIYTKSIHAPHAVGKYTVSVELNDTLSYVFADSSATSATMEIKKGNAVVWASGGTQHLFSDGIKQISTMSVPQLPLDVVYYKVDESTQKITAGEIHSPSAVGNYLYVITLHDSGNQSYVIGNALSVDPVGKTVAEINTLITNGSASNVGFMSISENEQPQLEINEFLIQKTYGDPAFDMTIGGTHEGATLTYDVVVGHDFIDVVGEPTDTAHKALITIKKPGVAVVKVTASKTGYNNVTALFAVEVAKKQVSISLDDNITYAGKDIVPGYTVSGLVGTDTLTNPITAASGETPDILFTYQNQNSDSHAFRNVGTYYVTAQVSEANEYYCSNGAASKMVQITKAPLTVTVNNDYILYGDTAPAYSVNYTTADNTNDLTKLRGEDTAAVLGGNATYTCDYAPYSNAGTYSISVQGLSSPNYEISFAPGTLTVSPKPVELTWSNSILTYNGTEQSVTATVTNAVNGDQVKVTTYTDNKATGQGNYTATATALDNSNYTLVTVNHPATVRDVAAHTHTPTNVEQSWTIAKKAATVKPANVTATVNGSAELKLDVSELLPADRNYNGIPNFTLSKDGSGISIADALKTAGTYTITWTNPGGITFNANANANYEITKTTTATLTVQQPSFGGGGGGGGGAAGGKPITVPDEIEHGKVQLDKEDPKPGDTVTVTVTPDDGYDLDKIVIKDENGNEIILTKTGDNTYTFVMPDGKVSVSATFRKISCSKDDRCPMTQFGDLKVNEWYHDGVHFCIYNGLMKGYPGNVFGPNISMTRAQIASIIWRMEGSPVVEYAMSFDDVADGQWYTEGIRWAQSSGVVSGFSETEFRPDEVITREQVVAMLYRYTKLQGKDVSVGDDTELLSFNDAESVSAWAVEAMQWAVGAGVVHGDNGSLKPGAMANRAEIATMIWRYCELINK